MDRLTISRRTSLTDVPEMQVAYVARDGTSVATDVDTQEGSRIQMGRILRKSFWASLGTD